MNRYILGLISLVILAGCTISYKFNGASIDYTKIKTITIKDFPNQATLVYPPLSQMFSEALIDIFTTQTRLSFVPNNGDIDLEGEIVGYDLTPQNVQADAYAAVTRLTVKVRVRYTNRNNPDEDFEQTFSAYRDFDSSKSLDSVQDELLREIDKELCELIYNATVGNW